MSRADVRTLPALNAGMVTRRSCFQDVCTFLKWLVAACLLADLCARGVTSLGKRNPKPLCVMLQWPARAAAASSASGRASKKQAYALLNGAVASLSSSLLETAHRAAFRVSRCRVQRAELKGTLVHVVACLLPMASVAHRKQDCSCFLLLDAPSLASAAALVGYPKRMSAGSRRSNRTNRTVVGKPSGSSRVGSALASDACERVERSLAKQTAITTMVD